MVTTLRCAVFLALFFIPRLFILGVYFRGSLLLRVRVRFFYLSRAEMRIVLWWNAGGGDVWHFEKAARMLKVEGAERSPCVLSCGWCTPA